MVGFMVAEILHDLYIYRKYITLFTSLRCTVALQIKKSTIVQYIDFHRIFNSWEVPFFSHFFLIRGFISIS